MNYVFYCCYTNKHTLLILTLTALMFQSFFDKQTLFSLFYLQLLLLHYHMDYLFCLMTYQFQRYLISHQLPCYQIHFLYQYGIFLIYLMGILCYILPLLQALYFYLDLLHTLLFLYCLGLLCYRYSSIYFLLLHRLSHLHKLLR